MARKTHSKYGRIKTESAANMVWMSQNIKLKEKCSDSGVDLRKNISSVIKNVPQDQVSYIFNNSICYTLRNILRKNLIFSIVLLQIIIYGPWCICLWKLPLHSHKYRNCAKLYIVPVFQDGRRFAWKSEYCGNHYFRHSRFYLRDFLYL